MPSSDRPEPRQDRRQRRRSASVDGRSAASAGQRRPATAPEPADPWDAASAEALTRLYESDEGNLSQRRRGKSAARRPDLVAGAPSGPGAAGDRAWLEAKLADIGAKLQALAPFDPSEVLAAFNGRLERIEQQMQELAQRADVGGQRLIEAQVLELAAHLDRTMGRLDRVDAIDEQVRSLARRIEEGGSQRLEALEKLLQDDAADRRRGEERTAGALRSLEDAVSRIGDAVETMEAAKPAPDLSLALLGPSDADAPRPASDPLEQMYADADRALGPAGFRSTLDAADYAPVLRPEHRPPPAAATPAAELAHGSPGTDVAREAATPALEAPALRASAIRARLRQAQMASDQAVAEAAPPPAPAGRRAARSLGRWARPGLLLTAGFVVFSTAGYLAVDALMGAGPREASAIDRGDVLPKAVAAGREAEMGEAPAMEAMAPDVRHGEDVREVRAPRPAPAVPEAEDVPERAVTPAVQAARIQGMGPLLAAAFRSGAITAPPPTETASIVQREAAPGDTTAQPPAAELPMTIGPASLRQAAQRGDPIAQHEVASRYAAGHGVTQDLGRAFQWYARAAMRGLAPAQYRLAALYERGLGTGADVERAKVWYGRAADQGHMKAMHNLAVLHAAGPRADLAVAAKWFAKAAAYGLTDSQFNLAVLHQNGIGVPKDLRQAYKWFALAARGGDKEATSRLAQLRAQLGQADRQAADDLVSAWRPSMPDAAVNELPPAAIATGQ